MSKSEHISSEALGGVILSLAMTILFNKSIGIQSVKASDVNAPHKCTQCNADRKFIINIKYRRIHTSAYISIKHRRSQTYQRVEMTSRFQMNALTGRYINIGYMDVHVSSSTRCHYNTLFDKIAPGAPICILNSRIVTMRPSHCFCHYF